MELNLLIDAINFDFIRISDHAFQEIKNDDLILDQVYESVLFGEVIENYPNSKPLPSCLVFGFSKFIPIHSVWAYNFIKNNATLITVYRPNPIKWVEYKKRIK